MNRSVFAATLLLAALSGACANTPAPSTDGPATVPGLTYTAWIDPAFDDATSAAIVAALDAWQAAVPGLVIAHWPGACPVGAVQTLCYAPGTAAQERTVYSVLLADGLEPTGIVLDGDTSRNSDLDSASIVIYPTGTLPDLVTYVVRHETGHGLGLAHRWAGAPTGDGTVMCWSSGCATSAITSVDVAQFWSIR